MAAVRFHKTPAKPELRRLIPATVHIHMGGVPQSDEKEVRKTADYDSTNRRFKVKRYGSEWLATVGYHESEIMSSFEQKNKQLCALPR